MKYTEEDLRKLADLIDNAYRHHTKNNVEGLDVVENFIKGYYKTEKVVEDNISFTYSFLRRKIDWEEFCKLTGVDYYATRNGFEIKDSDIFYITESKAKQFNLI